MPRNGQALLAQRWLGLSILALLGVVVATHGGTLGLNSAQALMASMRADAGMQALTVLALVHAAMLALPMSQA